MQEHHRCRTTHIFSYISKEKGTWEQAILLDDGEDEERAKEAQEGFCCGPYKKRKILVPATPHTTRSRPLKRSAGDRIT